MQNYEIPISFKIKYHSKIDILLKLSSTTFYSVTSKGSWNLLFLLTLRIFVAMQSVFLPLLIHSMNRARYTWFPVTLWSLFPLLSLWTKSRAWSITLMFRLLKFWFFSNLFRTKTKKSILTKQMSDSVMSKSYSHSSPFEYRAGKFGLWIRTGRESSKFFEQNDGRRSKGVCDVTGGDVVNGNSTAISVKS